jgi:hypothetical protein
MKVKTETVPMRVVPMLLATAIIRARARAVGIDNLWSETGQFDLTTSASRAFMSPPDHGERRRRADAQDDYIPSPGTAGRA